MSMSLNILISLRQVREARKRREERIATKKQELLQSYAKDDEQQTPTPTAKK
jgi:hypothetical protein